MHISCAGPAASQYQQFALQTTVGSTNIRVGSTIFGKRDYTGSKPSDPNEQETLQAEKSM